VSHCPPSAASALATRVDNVQAFLKHEYKDHVLQSMAQPEHPMSKCATHWPPYALAPPPPPPSTGAGPSATKKASKAATIPKKWTIKWPGTGHAEPCTMLCTACNAVPLLYVDVAEALRALGDAAAALPLLGKLDKCKARTELYMGHLLRCCVQTRHINHLIASVSLDPHHVHMGIDYKVRYRTSMQWNSKA